VVSRVLVAAEASGPVLILDEPISFWGGVEPRSGTIVEKGHPQYGESMEGRILSLSHGRGSSSSSSVLAEMIRRGSAPVGVILGEVDAMLVLGAVVAEELYGTATPVIVADRAIRDSLRTGEEARIEADGSVTIPGDLFRKWNGSADMRGR